MDGHDSFHVQDDRLRAIESVRPPETSPHSQPPTWPASTDVGDDALSALDEYRRTNLAEIEDNGDGTVTVVGAPSVKQREWLPMLYVEGGLSCDGRGVLWHLKESPDA